MDSGVTVGGVGMRGLWFTVAGPGDGAVDEDGAGDEDGAVVTSWGCGVGAAETVVATGGAVAEPVVATVGAAVGNLRGAQIVVSKDAHPAKPPPPPPPSLPSRYERNEIANQRSVYRRNDIVAQRHQRRRRIDHHHTNAHHRVVNETIRLHLNDVVFTVARNHRLAELLNNNKNNKKHHVLLGLVFAAVNEKILTACGLGIENCWKLLFRKMHLSNLRLVSGVSM